MEGEIVPDGARRDNDPNSVFIRVERPVLEGLVVSMQMQRAIFILADYPLPVGVLPWSLHRLPYPALIEGDHRLLEVIQLNLLTITVDFSLASSLVLPALGHTVLDRVTAFQLLLIHLHRLVVIHIREVDPLHALHALEVTLLINVPEVVLKRQGEPGPF